MVNIRGVDAQIDIERVLLCSEDDFRSEWSLSWIFKGPSLIWPIFKVYDIDIVIFWILLWLPNWIRLCGVGRYLKGEDLSLGSTIRLNWGKWSLKLCKFSRIVSFLWRLVMRIRWWLHWSIDYSWWKRGANGKITYSS